MICLAGSPKKTQPGAGMGELCERAAGSAEIYLGFGTVGGWAMHEGGRREGEAGDQDARFRRQDAGIARGTRERRGGEGDRGKTHFLAQVKEHPGNSERTSPAVQAHQRKPVLIHQSRVPAALGSARRPGNHRRQVASGAPRDTSGFVPARPGVVRLRGCRGSWTSCRRGDELVVGPDRFVSGPFCPAPGVGRVTSAPHLVALAVLLSFGSEDRSHL